jgi:RNA polymerase sigma-70 factor (ECF subfamily)
VEKTENGTLRRRADLRGPDGETPESLLVRYQRTQDPQALGALFDLTAPSLVRCAVPITGDVGLAEDAVQEAFLDLLCLASRYDAGRPVLPWLAGIVRRKALKARRVDRRTPDPLRCGARDVVEGPGPDADRAARALERLADPYRSVAVLRWRYGLSPAEIAEARGEPPGTTRSLLFRVLGRLRHALRGMAAFIGIGAPPRGLLPVRETIVQAGAASAPPAGAAAVVTGAAVSNGFLSVAVAGLLGVGASWFAAAPAFFAPSAARAEVTTSIVRVHVPENWDRIHRPRARLATEADAWGWGLDPSAVPARSASPRRGR